MVVANLVHRPIRSLISVIAVAVEVVLILVVVGLMVGMLNDARARNRGIGADVIVQPPGSSVIGQISGAPVSIKVADVLRKLPHVAVVAPVVSQLNTSGAVELIYGIDLKSYEALGGPFRFLAGGPFTGPNDVIIDDFIATSQHRQVGQSMTVLNHKFRICGVVEHGRGARKFLQITTMQQVIGAEGKASIFYLKTDAPQNAGEVVKEINAVPGMSEYPVRTIQDWLSMMTPENLPGFSTTVDVVIGVAVIIGFIVIFQAMYTAVMERTREIGILKSMGASKLYIVNVVLRETAVLAVVGILLGIGISLIAERALIQRFPTVRVEVSAHWVLNACLIAMIGALLGALYPAFKAAQKDPIDALAYE
jgi:putative ABC transport system permease protein